MDNIGDDREPDQENNLGIVHISHKCGHSTDYIAEIDIPEENIEALRNMPCFACDMPIRRNKSTLGGYF